MCRGYDIDGRGFTKQYDLVPVGMTYGWEGNSMPGITVGMCSTLVVYPPMGSRQPT